MSFQSLIDFSISDKNTPRKLKMQSKLKSLRKEAMAWLTRLFPSVPRAKYFLQETIVVSRVTW